MPHRRLGAFTAPLWKTVSQDRCIYAETNQRSKYRSGNERRRLDAGSPILDVTQRHHDRGNMRPWLAPRVTVARWTLSGGLYIPSCQCQQPVHMVSDSEHAQVVLVGMSGLHIDSSSVTMSPTPYETTRRKMWHTDTSSISSSQGPCYDEGSRLGCDCSVGLE